MRRVPFATCNVRSAFSKILTSDQVGKVVDALRDVDVAHFTCHGYTDQAHPMESGLVLSPYGTRQPPTKHIRRMSVAQRSVTLLRPSRRL